MDPYPIDFAAGAPIPYDRDRDKSGTFIVGYVDPDGNPQSFAVGYAPGEPDLVPARVAGPGSRPMTRHGWLFRFLVADTYIGHLALAHASLFMAIGLTLAILAGNTTVWSRAMPGLSLWAWVVIHVTLGLLRAVSAHRKHTVRAVVGATHAAVWTFLAVLAWSEVIALPVVSLYAWLATFSVLVSIVDLTQAPNGEGLSQKVVPDQ